MTLYSTDSRCTQKRPVRYLWAGETPIQLATIRQRIPRQPLRNDSPQKQQIKNSHKEESNSNIFKNTKSNLKRFLKVSFAVFDKEN